MGDACATDMKMIIYCQPIVLGQNKRAEKTQRLYTPHRIFFPSCLYMWCKNYTAAVPRFYFGNTNRVSCRPKRYFYPNIRAVQRFSKPTTLSMIIPCTVYNTAGAKEFLTLAKHETKAFI